MIYVESKTFYNEFQCDYGDNLSCFVQLNNITQLMPINKVGNRIKVIFKTIIINGKHNQRYNRKYGLRSSWLFYDGVK